MRSSKSYNEYQTCLENMYEQFTDKHWKHTNVYGLVRAVQYDKKYEKHMRWEEMVGLSWVMLLKTNPEYAPRCKWETLDDTDWNKLLSCRPEFKMHYKLSNL